MSKIEFAIDNEISHEGGGLFLLDCQVFLFKLSSVIGLKTLPCFPVSVVEYSCLGDWFVGKNHFFAVANTKESRRDEKYRCFLKNRDDDYFLGASITPECNSIKTVSF